MGITKLKPIDSGRRSLTEETLDAAIKMLNQVRYIAGISYNVTLNHEYNAKAQAASVYMPVSSCICHQRKDYVTAVPVEGTAISSLAKTDFFYGRNHFIVYL